MTNPIRPFRPVFLFFLLIALSHSTRAQQKAGYYVSLSRDTIRGVFPHYTASVISPAAITFLPAGASQAIELTPNTCSVVAIDQSDKFVAYHGPRLTNPATDAQALTGARSDEYDNINAFLRELYNDGAYRLYKFTDLRRSNFYAGGDTLQELYYKTFVEAREVKEAFQFRQQLFVLFRSQIDADPGLKDKLVYTHYSEANLLYFFTAATGHRQHSVETNFPVRFFVGVGVSANFFSVDVGSPYTLIARGRFRNQLLAHFTGRLPVTRRPGLRSVFPPRPPPGL